jgi:hypothetical protein
MMEEGKPTAPKSGGAGASQYKQQGSENPLHPAGANGSGDTIDRPMSEMTVHRLRHLPVVERGRLIGLVSIGDVVKMRVSEVEMETTAMRDYTAG